MELMFVIKREPPDSAAAEALIIELEAVLSPLYPDESRHGYSVAQLLDQGVPFFVGRYGEMPAACGGIMLVGRDYGEVKRMYVRPQFRGLGLGRALLMHLQEFALANGVSLMRLETGIHQKAAINLYEKFGFYQIPPFGPYKEDPLSLFFEKTVA